jgi:cobalamin biosynthesis protein CobD/CbiB
MEFYFIFIVPAAALILDTLLGDPKSLPHPVRLVGRVLDLYEASARRVGIGLRAAGWAAVILLPAAAWSAAEFLMAIPYLGALVAVYLAYAGLALGCLAREAYRVAALLDTGDLAGARRALSMLVSRDTSDLSPDEVRRTLAETVSENLNDGLVAPMFYLVLLGPGGLWAYKTVSTMDSMWGYRTQRYRDLGRGAAKTMSRPGPMWPATRLGWRAPTRAGPWPPPRGSWAARWGAGRSISARSGKSPCSARPGPSGTGRWCARSSGCASPLAIWPRGCSSWCWAACAGFSSHH